MHSRWLRKSGQAAWVMGVLNCTPDSFSDGSETHSAQSLIKKAKKMVDDGANIVDVGGESTRPNAKAVSLDEELSRVIPVIQGLPKDIVISIDTTKAEVMRQAIASGATLVNDVSALSMDKNSLEVVAETGVDTCLMHMKGSPRIMQKAPVYKDVVAEVSKYFEQRIEVCLAAGIQASSIILDPGIGFGKRLEDNLKLIANLEYFKKSFGFPLLLGVSRKSFLGLLTGAEVEQREIETATASAIGIFCGADIIRVHDCKNHYKTSMVASMLTDYKQQSLLC